MPELGVWLYSCSFSWVWYIGHLDLLKTDTNKTPHNNKPLSGRSSDPIWCRSLFRTWSVSPINSICNSPVNNFLKVFCFFVCRLTFASKNLPETPSKHLINKRMDIPADWVSSESSPGNNPSFLIENAAPIAFLL